MVRIDAAQYLPISDRIVGEVLDEAGFEEALGRLTVPEIASLIALQYLPRLRERPSLSLDRILSEIIETGNAAVSRKGVAAFRAEALKVLHRGKISAGRQLLAEFGIALLDGEALQQRDFLSSASLWDSSFRDRHQGRQLERLRRITLPGRGSLTTEQSQIFREVQAQSDDHIHVQGYAGTGKSFLIQSLLAMLQSSGSRTLILAERQRQLNALLAGIGKFAHVHARRFDTLASEMAPTNLTDPTTRRMSRVSYSPAPIADEDLVRHLGIQPSSSFAPRDVAKMVRSTVAKFCYSAEGEIDSEHIPDWCAASLDPATKQIVLHFATQLWQAILNPSRSFHVPMRGYHKVKWVALQGWKIPARYTHVLVDECHNLAKPMLQILDGSPQAVISLGDEYQTLQGRAQLRSNVVRQRAITWSVRSGRSIEQVVNPIVSVHPGKIKLPFHGNPANETELSYYDKPQIPADPAAILVSDTWSLFEWVQRLATSEVEFELLSSRGDLDMFVSDCIELYRHGTRPRHGELFRFGSWSAVGHRYHDNGGFQRIDRMLAKGYDGKNWSMTLAKLAQQCTSGFAIGLISDVRNLEFDCVMLTPDVIAKHWGSEHATFAANSAAIYIAVTRARRRLVVPERLRNWIEEISAGSRASKLP